MFPFLTSFNAQYLNELKEVRKGNINAYSLFLKETRLNATEKGEKTSFQQIAEKWKKLNGAAKDKFKNEANRLNEEKGAKVDQYQIAFNIKPKRPIGAFRIFLRDCAGNGKLEGKKNILAEGYKMFNSLSQNDKNKYQAQAKKEQLIYAIKKLEFTKYLRSLRQDHSVSAYNVFIRENASLFGKDKNLKGEKFMEYMGKKFNELDSKKKQYYQDIADKESRTRGAKSDEFNDRVFDVPKRPANIYGLYVKENFSKIYAKNNNFIETQNKLATAWKQLKPADKGKYEKENEKLTEDYKGHLKDFETYGFFNPNHKEMNDLPEIKPKKRVKRAKTTRRKARGKKRATKTKAKKTQKKKMTQAKKTQAKKGTQAKASKGKAKGKGKSQVKAKAGTAKKRKN